MGFILCLVIPVVVLLVILIACKLMNFSILPEGLKLPSPKKFKIPQVRRNGYKWEAWSSDINDDDDDYDDDDSDEDYDSDEDDDEDDYDSDDEDWEF